MQHRMPFCERTINDVEERPGVTSKVIIQKPAVVVDMVVMVAVDVEHRMDCHKINLYLIKPIEIVYYNANDNLSCLQKSR